MKGFRRVYWWLACGGVVKPSQISLLTFILAACEEGAAGRDLDSSRQVQVQSPLKLSQILDADGFATSTVPMALASSSATLLPPC